MDLNSALVSILGLACIFIVLVDAFETIVLPRTVKRAFRMSNLFFFFSSLTYRVIGKMKKSASRQVLLVAYAPLLMLLLIVFWAVMLIAGFALLWQGLGLPFVQEDMGNIGGRAYFAGSTFFTLNFGDATPVAGFGRVLAVAEAGVGLGFLALIISYIPVLYNAFSRREVTILLLDSKAGSEPTAAELLRRHAEHNCVGSLSTLLKDWETFSAQLLESYLSYPALAFYRSQHDDQSWLCSLTAIMDCCTLICGGFEEAAEWQGPLKFQAKATFAMARHVIVDLAYILDAEPKADGNRLPEETLTAIRHELSHLRCALDDSPEATERIKKMRDLYEPHVKGLSKRLLMDLPDWMPRGPALDNWQTSAWDGMHF